MPPSENTPTYNELKVHEKSPEKLKEMTKDLTADQLNTLIKEIEGIAAKQKILPNVYTAISDRAEALKKYGERLDALAGKIEFDPGRIDDLLKVAPLLDQEKKELLEQSIESLLFARGLLEANYEQKEEAGIKEKSDMDGLLAVLERNEVKTRVEDLLKVDSKDAAGRLFTTQPPPTDEQLKAMHFLALVCKKYEAILRWKFDGKRGNPAFEKVRLLDMLTYMGDMLRGAAKIAETVAKGDFKDVDLEKLTEDIVPEEKLEQRMKKSLGLKQRLLELNPKLVGKEKEFSGFCAAYKHLPIKGLTTETPKNAVPTFGKEDTTVFVEALNKLDELICGDWKTFIVRAGHRDDFKSALEKYIDEKLTIGDAIQLYGYLHEIRNEGGQVPDKLSKGDPMAVFLLQMKSAQMVARQDKFQGRRMKFFLFNKSAETLIDSAPDIDLPDGVKLFMKQAAEIVAREGKNKIGDWFLDKAELLWAWLLEAPTWAKILSGVGGAWTLRLAWLKVRSRFRFWSLRSTSALTEEEIKKKYGVDADTAAKIKLAATAGASTSSTYGRLSRNLRIWRPGSFLQWRGHEVLRKAQEEIADLVKADHEAKLAGGKKPGRTPLDTSTRGDVRANKADLSGKKLTPGDWVKMAQDLGIKIDGKSPAEIESEVKAHPKADVKFKPGRK